MLKKVNKFVLLLMVVAVLMSSTIGTTTVYADDGVAGGESSEPAGEETPPVYEDTPPEQAGDENIPAEEQPIAPTEEQPSVEEPLSVPEILEQLPEDTELVVVNEAGEVEPLVTEAAAEIIAVNDPMWCPSSVTTVSGCVNDTQIFGAGHLLDKILALAPTVAGTIYFTSNYDVDDASFDGSLASATEPAGAFSTIRDYALTLQGGWDGDTTTGSTINFSTTIHSVFSVPVTIWGWNANVTINNIEIISGVANVDYGLGVATTGDIELDSINVHGTGGTGDGAKLSNIGGGDVSITESEFNDNLGGNGLLVESSGTITLNTVQASGNLLTGAYLNNCRYASGQCQGNDLVTVTSTTTNQFNNNGFDGLVIDAGGGIAMDHVAANDNGVNGATLTSTDTNGIGNVVVTQSDFNLNANGTGLDILADGNINLTDVTASDNRSGAALDTTDGIGAITVDASNFVGNTSTGLHAESGSTTALTNVDASDNGTNGAYLEAAGNITVTDSTFNDNVHFNFPSDPGLYANSNGGNITLSNVIADGNDYGAGVVLTTRNAGVIDVAGGHFNENGTFGIQSQSQDGDIVLDGIAASLNKVKGAYLKSYGLGNIFINDSSFVENGSYGIYATTSQGDINLDLVTVTGDNGVDDGAVGTDNLTDYGAVLGTQNGGEVFVSDSAFTLNTGVGLQIISSGQVNLINATTDQNGGNGVEVYSTYTYSCRCPDSKVVNIKVNVDGGTFTDNGDYGLMVKPGSEGDLTFVNPSTFGGNGLGDYLLDLSDPTECKKCGCDEDENKPPTDDSTGPKDHNIVDVPFTGGDPVRLDYKNFSSTILRLPNGNLVEFIYPSFEGFGNLEGLLEENLPGRLGAGTNFIDGITVSLTDEEGNVSENRDGTISIEFKLPEDSHGRYSILYWDPTLNDGAGGWVQLPLYEVGTSFPLNPDDPEDGRTILSGVQQIGDTLTVTVNFSGIFVLVAR